MSRPWVSEVQGVDCPPEPRRPARNAIHTYCAKSCTRGVFVRVSFNSATMGNSHPYFAKGQRNPLESCDILLKLDDGTELPAHIQVLARCMPVFDDMLAGGPLNKASVNNVISVPFSDCSLKEAHHFLAAIYSIEASEYIDDRSALSTARLSHKYGGEHMVRLCDNALAKIAGIDSDDFVKFPSNLEKQGLDKFMDIMTSAILFGMPKLLACCEYYAVIDTFKEAHMGLAMQTELRARCSRETLLDRRCGSWKRIAEGHAIVFQTVFGKKVDKYHEVTPCSCECCKSMRRNNGAASCSCSKKGTSAKTMAQLVPRPMEFFQMAMAEADSQKATLQDDPSDMEAVD